MLTEERKEKYNISITYKIEESNSNILSGTKDFTLLYLKFNILTETIIFPTLPQIAEQNIANKSF